MLHHLRWMWRGALRSLRLEFVITMLVVALPALTTMMVPLVLLGVSDA